MLFAIVFLWQFPHFMAIAWMYREDYTRAGYLVLPLGERRNRSVIWQTLVASLALLLVSLISTITSASGLVYFAGILVPGAIFFYYSVSLKFQKSSATARKLLLASILYLPSILVLISPNKK
jgi:protoheme IX farnesyltransferase